MSIFVDPTVPQTQASSSTTAADRAAGIDYSTGKVKPKPDALSTVKAKKLKAKIATSNLFNLGEPPTKPDTLFDLSLQNVGGQDIISLVRTDTVNGSSFKNDIIVNLKSINEQFDSNKIIPLMGQQQDYFDSFDYDILSYIPDPETSNYVVESSGNIVFNFINLTNEKIEVQFLSIQENLNSTGGYPSV